ncbi:MAG: hypothetical protein V4580_06570 [Bacteroidota bacterium]
MKYLTLLLVLIATHTSFSQRYFYLEKVVIKDPSEYVENEHNAVKAIEYMASTPIDDKDFDRKACVRFIIRYAEGCPGVTVTLDGYVSKLYKKNFDLLPMFMGFWVQSFINDKKGTQADQELFTVTALYTYVKDLTGHNIKSNDAIKSLIEAGDNGKIAEWIKAHK